MTMKPAFCSSTGSVIQGCLTDSEATIELLFRTEHIQIFSAKEIIVENLAFNGKENIYFVGIPEYGSGFTAPGLACFNDPNVECCSDDMEPIDAVT